MRKWLRGGSVGSAFKTIRPILAGLGAMEKALPLPGFYWVIIGSGHGFHEHGTLGALESL